MTAPDSADGTTAGAPQAEITSGHIKANAALIHALKIEGDGWFELDPNHFTPELNLEINNARDIIADLIATARGGTD